MSVFTITLLKDNQKIDHPYVLKGLDVQHEVNKIPFARIVFVDGDPSQQTFALSSSAHFIPGQEIEIKARYEEDAGTETTIFKGLIVKHGIEADIKGSFLMIELKGKSFKMTTRKKNLVFRDQEETAVFRELIESNGLQPGDLASTQGEHQELVQYYCTDWDFLLTRADVHGLWVHAQQGNISLVNPADIDTSNPDYRFSFGIDPIFNLHLEINAEKQLDQVNSLAWDIANKALTEPLQATDYSTTVGDLNGTDLAAAVGSGEYQLQNVASLTTEELQAWADSTVRRSRLAMVRGTFSVQGMPTIQLLHTMSIEGIGERFNGNAIISGVRHRFSEDGWITDVQFGLPASRFVEQHPVEELPAGGLLPGVRGLQLGLIDTFEEDPNEQFRVRVKLPALGAEESSVWARLATPDAGDGRGFFFRPEEGDEVIVGFVNDDPRQAIILGGLFSQVLAPPIEADQVNETNPLKGIFSREGIQVKIDDENKKLQILTAEDHSITLDQNEEKIAIQDVHGNTITMDSSGIVIKSASDLKIEASGNVEIKGSKVDVK